MEVSGNMHVKSPGFELKCPIAFPSFSMQFLCILAAHVRVDNRSRYTFIMVDEAPVRPTPNGTTGYPSPVVSSGWLLSTTVKADDPTNRLGWRRRGWIGDHVKMT